MPTSLLLFLFGCSSMTNMEVEEGPPMVQVLEHTLFYPLFLSTK
jgi:hypothetical protein